MRILHLIGSLSPKVGGPAEGLKRIHQSCAPLGYNLEVACLDQSKDAHLAQLPFPVYPLGAKTGTYGFTPKLLPWLQANYRNYDGVVVNGIWQYHGYAAWKAVRGRLPYFVFTHGMLDPWFQHKYPAKHIKKLAYWGVAERQILNDANAVLFTAPAEKELARQNFFGHRWNGVVVPYGALGPQEKDLDFRREFLQHCPRLQSRRMLLYLGRLHEKKGCDLLIRAFARFASEVPDLDLVMAGPDAHGYQEKLRLIAAHNGISDRIHWTGILQGNLKWGAFQRCEAFILPSHQENFGIAVAEALSCGRPVLISNKVNICKEIAQDGAGFVAPDDQGGTELLIERWLGTSEAERERMREAAKATFEQRYNIQNCGRTLMQLFECAQAGKQPSTLPIAA